MLTAQVEPFAPFLEEVKPLLEQHYEELALNKDKVPLAPQYELYLERDRRGEILLITLRRHGRLVGYFVGFIAPGLHYRTCLTLQMDIYWTHPDIRGGTAGLRLMKAVEKEAKRRGVQRVFYGSKLHKDSGRLFEAIGCAEVERYYSKWIGG